MLKIITLICVLLAVLTAILSEAWMRNKRGQGENIGRIFGILRGRTVNFIVFQYPSVLIAVIIIGAAIGIAVSWRSAAVYAVGAAVCCAANLMGLNSYVSGGVSSASAGLGGDIRLAVKSSHRAGQVLGACVTGIGLFTLGALFLVMDVDTAINVSSCLALGASTAAALLNVGGRVYSSAYSMAAPGNDFTDTAGLYAGSGAELFESYIASAAAVMLLAQSASDLSGFGTVVTASDAAKFPLIIYASGIAASIIGNLFFNVRSMTRPAGGITLGCILAGLMTAGASLYFSLRFFDTFQYGLPVVTGIAGGILLGEISKFFSRDGRLFMRNYKADRRLGSQAPALFNMGSGMMSVFFYAVIIVTVLVVAYNLCSLYGIALCAAGFASAAICFASVTGVSIIGDTASGIVRTSDDESDREVLADILENASVRSDTVAASYILVSSALAAAAVFFAFMNGLQIESIDLMQPYVISGFLGGVAATFVLLGIIITSVRLTGRVALRSLNHSDEDTGAAGSLRGSLIPAVCAVAFPTMVGLLFGISVLISFLIAALFTGIILVAVFNDSGIQYKNSAAQSLVSVVKLMILFSLVFSQVFIHVGGFLSN